MTDFSNKIIKSRQNTRYNIGYSKNYRLKTKKEIKITKTRKQVDKKTDSSNSRIFMSNEIISITF